MKYTSVFAPILNTRLCTQNFKTRFAKTNLGLNAPLNRTVNLCNKLAQKSKFDIFNDSLRSYKAQLKKYFIYLVKNPRVPRTNIIYIYKYFLQF